MLNLRKKFSSSFRQGSLTVVQNQIVRLAGAVFLELLLPQSLLHGLPIPSVAQPDPLHDYLHGALDVDDSVEQRCEVLLEKDG